MIRALSGARIIRVLVGLAIAGALAAPASAYFASGGTATASGRVGTLGTPSITGSSSGAGTATITWASVPSPSSGTVSYYVTRDGGAPAGNCPTASNPSSTLTSCTDSGLSKGSYSYAVTEVWRSWTATSAATGVSVGYGAPSQVVLSHTATGSLTSGSGTDTLTAKVEDAAGNLVTSGSDSGDSVTFSQTAGGGSVSGLGSAAASGGIATLTVTGNKAGSVTIGASTTFNGATTATTSNTLTDTVVAGAASQIALSHSATGNLTSGSGTDTLTAKVEDAAGNLVTSGTDSSDTIKFAQTNSGSGAGSVTGLGTSPATGGIATLTVTGNLAGSVNIAASATFSGATTATTSNAVTDTVVPGSASQLVFTTQPDGGAVAGSPFPTQPVVTAEDAAGNTVTGYTKAITLSIASGTGTSGAKLSGCSPTQSSGVTTFTGCQLDTAGTGYKLTATDTTTPTALSGTSNPFNVGTSLSASSVAEATGPASPLATGSITPVSNSTYLIFVYCYGQSSSCNGTAAEAAVSSPAFSSITFVKSEGAGSGTSKNCLEVFSATGTSTPGAVTVTGATGQSIGFVNVVQLSPGAKVQNGSSVSPASGTSSPATAALSSPPSNWGELVPVAVDDGSGDTTISVQTPTTGMARLGVAQQSSTVGADLSVYFDPTAQASASFTLNPANPLNGWATFAIEVG